MTSSERGTMTVEASGRSAGVRDWLKLLRPKHWAKNVFVLAPLLFSGRATEAAVVADAILVFVAFCFAASAVYAFNDVIDCSEDRAHPVKRHRPVAASRIGTGSAGRRRHCWPRCPSRSPRSWGCPPWRASGATWP